MIEKLLAFISAAWALWRDWSARSKQQAAEKTAADMQKGAEQAAAETATVVKEVADARASLDPSPADPDELAKSLRSRKKRVK